jgi:hypothetical protein
MFSGISGPAGAAAAGAVVPAAPVVDVVAAAVVALVAAVVAAVVALVVAAAAVVLLAVVAVLSPQAASNPATKRPITRILKALYFFVINYAPTVEWVLLYYVKLSSSPSRL